MKTSFKLQLLRTSHTFAPPSGCFNGFTARCTPPHSSERRRRLPSSSSLAMATTALGSSQAVAPPPGDAWRSSDAYKMIQAHQVVAARLSPIEEVRAILDLGTRGVLCTMSQDHEGYPSGSMVDFACDQDGSVILAFSSLAIHSKNILWNHKCSLLVAKDPEDGTDMVITIFGDALAVPEENREAARSTYLKKHPKAYSVDFGDFRLCRIEPKVVRYLSGVATSLHGSGEFSFEEFKEAKVDPISQFTIPITSHMNRDHAEDTKAIVQHIISVKVDYAYMLTLDSLGFDVKVGYEGNTLKLRIPFPRHAQDRKDVKTLIVEMLQAAEGCSSKS